MFQYIVMICVTEIYITYMSVTYMLHIITYIYVTYMSGTYIAIYVKYMYKQHYTITDLWYKYEYFNMTLCTHQWVMLVCVLFLRFPCTQGNATNKIIYAVFKYIHVYYTCDKFKKRTFWNTEKVFDKLVDIEINIIFKI